MSESLDLVRYGEATNTDKDPDCELFDWRAFVDNGLLWAMNRHVLHPLGLALAWFYPEAEDGSPGEEPSGWQIVRSIDGLWAFAPESDDEGAAKYRAFLAYLAERPPPAAEAPA